MQSKATYFLLLLLALWSGTLCAQIVDDSTVNRYSPKTVIIQSEEQFILGSNQGQNPDTSLTNIHRTDEWRFDQNTYQKNLGFIGSAQQPYFFYTNLNIGLRLGREAFSYLYYNAADMPYYRTYNLYSKLHYIQGSFGRQWIEVILAKNLTEHVNVTLNFRRATSQRQLNVVQFRQKAVDHNSLNVNANGSFLKSRLRTLVGFSLLTHRVYETGGVQPAENDRVDSLYDFELEQVRFNIDTYNNERRVQLRALVRYQLDSADRTGVYAGFDRYQQQDRFHQPSDGNPEILGDRNFSSTVTEDLVQYQSQDFFGGVYGRIRGLATNFTVLRRNLRYVNPFISFNTPTAENHLIANVRFTYKEILFAVQGHKILGRDDKLVVQASTPWLKGKVGFLSSSPTFTQLAVASNSVYWQNNFNFVNTTFAYGEAEYRSKRQSLRPFVEWQSIKNYIFYNEQARPEQTAVPLSIVYVGLNADLALGSFKANIHARQSIVNNKEIMRLPATFALASVYFDRELSKGRYQLQAGVEARYRTGFASDNYAPATQQFYLSNQAIDSPDALQNGYMPVQTHTLIDVFVNLRINRTRGFFKLGNALQDLGSRGYFDTPFYPGQRRFFEFGVDWMLFD